MIRFISKIKAVDCSCRKHNFTNLNKIRQRACLLLCFIVKDCIVTVQYHGGIDFRKTAIKPHLLVNAKLSFNVVTLLGGPNLMQNVFYAKSCFYYF